MQLNSIFKPDKRDEALERIVIGINEAAKNCTTIIKKINSLCQKPEDYPNPFSLIDEWVEGLFVNHFHDFIEEWISPIIISVEDEETLSNAFFKYFASLTPFFYENKKIISPDVIKPRKYIWTNDDYKELKVKLLQRWFYSEWDNIDGETKLKIGADLILKTQKVVKSIAASSKANSKAWNKQKKIDEIVFPEELILTVNGVMPLYEHQHQRDLFLYYVSEFVNRLPSVYKKFDNNFYEVGTYLYKFFQWS